MAGPNGPVAQQLVKDRDKIERATDVIDRDPGEAKAILDQGIVKAPNVGDITMGDMFQLLSQMQAQAASMQAQILTLMGQPNQSRQSGVDLKKEMKDDQIQRELTLKSWDTEPREPTYLPPSADEEKIHAVTGKFPPHPFWVNGLMFPVNVGEIVSVPSSIARMVETTQRRRPLSGAPQALGQIADPARGQFLAGSQSIEMGLPGKSGEGRLIPDGLPPPQPLGLKYDHNGQ